MPRDPATGIYTPLNPRSIKRSQYITSSILVGAATSVPISIRGDIADYFGIAAVPGGTDGYREVTKRRTGRLVFAAMDDLTGVQSLSTTNDKHLMPGKISSGRGGRVIIVPTELTTPKGSIRTGRIRFPAIANLAAISNFLATKCVTHKPTYFLTLSGVKRVVAILPTGKDPNTDLPLGRLGLGLIAGGLGKD